MSDPSPDELILDVDEAGIPIEHLPWVHDWGVAVGKILHENVEGVHRVRILLEDFDEIDMFLQVILFQLGTKRLAVLYLVRPIEAGIRAPGDLSTTMMTAHHFDGESYVKLKQAIPFKMVPQVEMPIGEKIVQMRDPTKRIGTA